MRAPKELFWVDVKTSPGDRLYYGEKGGGKFTDLAAARDRKHMILRRHPSATVRIFRSSLAWEEVEA